MIREILFSMTRTKIKIKTKDKKIRKNISIVRSLRDSEIVAYRLSHS